MNKKINFEKKVMSTKKIDADEALYPTGKIWSFTLKNNLVEKHLAKKAKWDEIQKMILAFNDESIFKGIQKRKLSVCLEDEAREKVRALAKKYKINSSKVVELILEANDN